MEMIDIVRELADRSPWKIHFSSGSRCFFCGIAKNTSRTHNTPCLWYEAVAALRRIDDRS